MPRTANDTSAKVHRPDLLKAMSRFMVPGVFAALETGGWAWSAWMLALGAILMVWDSTLSLTGRFDSVRATLRELFPKKPLGDSYQGFIKALVKHSPALLSVLTDHLRRRMAAQEKRQASGTSTNPDRLPEQLSQAKALYVKIKAA